MADDPTPEPLRSGSRGSARKVRQARELLQGFSSELIGVEQFADLLGLSASTAAQIRRDRRAAADLPADPRAGVRAVEFPAGIPDGARSVVHRLGGLLDWIEHVSRYEAMVELDPTTIARWRLDRRVRSATAKSGTARTRCGLAAIALQHVSTGTADEELAADLWQAALQPNSTARVNTEAIPKLAPEVDRLWASLAAGDPSQPATTSRRRLFADALDDIALAPDLADTFSESRRTAAGLSTLVEAALDVQPGQRLLEHGCGECRVMAAVAEETRDASGRQTVELFGSESDERAYLIGRARLALRGLDHHITHGRYRPSIGVVAAADQYERILVDLGSKDPDLIQWLDDASTLCTPDGRVVVVMSTSASRLLLASGRVPNVAVIISTGTMAGSIVPGVLWIAEHDPSLPSPHEIRVIDLRGATSDDERTAAADGLRRLLRGEQLEWPSTHRVTIDALADAANDLVAAISARRSDLQANRRYGLQLTRELARLIGRGTTGVHSDPTGNNRQSVLPQQPAHSPDGILADVTTDEVRRIIRRLVDHLDRDPSGGSRPTTGG